LFDRIRNSNVNRGWEGIIGALPHVDMIIGVNQLLLAHPIPTGNLGRSIADHFVDVHVTAGTAAGLEDVNGELISKFAIGNF
jgi:hypothetical protein